MTASDENSGFAGKSILGKAASETKAACTCWLGQ